MATFNAQMNGSADYVLRLVVNQSSQNITGNYSTVSWSLSAHGSWGSWTNSSAPYKITINGTVYSGTITGRIDPNPSQTVRTGTTRVNHNANGTKTISVSGYWNVPHSAIGAATASGSLTLSTIPRASTSTWAASGTKNIGSTYTLNTNRASSGFTHTLTYKFGSATGTIGTGVGGSIAWAIPASLMNQIPTATSGTGTITTKTYSGSSLIGTTTSSIALSVPTNIVPTVGATSVEEAVPEVATKVGAYMEGLSKLTWNITGSSSQYGATIVTRRFRIASGAWFSGASGTVPEAIKGSGTIPVTYSVIDSRGRESQDTKNIEVLPYSRPINTINSIKRALSDGTEDSDDGTYLKINLIAQAQSIDNGVHNVWVVDEPESYVTHPAETIYVNDAGSTVGWTPSPSPAFVQDDLDGGIIVSNNDVRQNPTKSAIASENSTGLEVGRTYTFSSSAKIFSTANRVRMTLGSGSSNSHATSTPATISGTWTATSTSATLSLIVEDNPNSTTEYFAYGIFYSVTVTANAWTETIPEVGHWEERPGGEQNTLAIKVFSKLRGAPESDWELKHTLNSPTIYHNTPILVTGPFLVDQSYEIRVDVVDLFNISPKITIIAVASIFMHWGPGLGVNKYWENGSLDVKGSIYSTTDVNAKRLRLSSDGDASLDGTDHGLQVGPTEGLNIIVDGNEVMSRNNGGPGEMNIQIDGGNINIGKTNGDRVLIRPRLENPFLPYAMAAGVANVTASFPVVTLPSGRFTHPPVVTAQLYSGSGGDIGVGTMVTNVTTTQFQCRHTASSGTKAVHWHAIQMNPGSANG